MNRGPVIAPNPPEDWDTLTTNAKKAFMAELTYVDISVVCPKGWAQIAFERVSRLNPVRVGWLGWIDKFFREAAEKGLFARVNMPAGTFIGEYLGDSILVDSPDTPLRRIFWPHGQFVEGELKPRQGYGALSYANHSGKAPNIKPVPHSYFFHTLTDVSAGDELTWDYTGHGLNFCDL